MTVNKQSQKVKLAQIIVWVFAIGLWAATALMAWFIPVIILGVVILVWAVVVLVEEDERKTLARIYGDEEDEQ